MTEIKSKINVLSIASAHYDSGPMKWITGQKIVDDRPNGLGKHELIYRLNGSITTNFDGVVLESNADTIEFLLKTGGQKYRITNNAAGPCITIFFDSDLPLFDEATLIDASRNVKYRQMFDEINKIWLEKKEGYYFKAMSVLYKIIELIAVETAKSNDASPIYRKIKKGIAYIDANYTKADIDFLYAAQLCSMSGSNFRKLFSEYTGQAPIKYVIEKRIEYAKELLATGRYNVSQVADSVGYDDIYYFSRLFKKMVGMPPSKYANIFK